MENLRQQIAEIVHRKTAAWNTQNVELLLSIFHPDMVWVWPNSNRDHDPMQWVLGMGKFNCERWKASYTQFFKSHRLIHNHREIKKIEVSTEGDGAFAVVDIDTQWESLSTNEMMRWEGRVCKVYSKVEGEWKLTMHTGVLKY